MMIVAVLLAIAVLGTSVITPASDRTNISFDADIRPILSNHCFRCHGPDEKKREADLRLDVPGGATQDLGGVAAVVPGQPLNSQLLERVRSTDVDLRMPPPDAGERLTEEQITLLEAWIEEGASYSQHWSFEPVQRPALPDVTNSAPEEWRQNPVDAFVFERLDRAGIQPAPEADRNTLLRRVHLDLLGLPPTLDELNDFLDDPQPGAYERMLDRVLMSEHFGERWGRHWLDQARYADSHGYTNDNERSIWPYRDWVIDAFNRDLPFDQFTIEQLAGDLLGSPTREQRVATGFHRNTLINSEGGTKADQFRDEQVKDRVDTTGLVWMGLTLGCAKCHAHKFDPLTQPEYYSLYAFFNSTADNNSVTPTLTVPSEEQTQELEQLRRQRAKLSSQVANDPSRAERQTAWESALLARQESAEAGSQDLGESLPWKVLELSAKSDKLSMFESLEDRSLLVSGPGTSLEEYQSTALSPLTKIRSVRLEVLTHESLPQHGPGRAENGNFVLSEFWFRTGDGRELRFSKAAAEHSQPDFSVSQAIDGKDDTGWAINQAADGPLNQDRTAWFVLPAELEVEENHALVFKMQFHVNDNYAIGRYRLSISDQEWADRPNESQVAVLLAIPVDQRSQEQQARIDKAFIQSDPHLGPIEVNLEQIDKRIEAIEQRIPTTMVLQELEKPRQAYVQVRGDFLRPGDDVLPGVPHFLPPIVDGPESSPRLAFARWLVQPDHPLTARVRVNRIWMRLFGRGLVETENDFGIQGSLPTHPELLDWLAFEFMRHGWSTKQLLKQIMTSATYRQSSKDRPELARVDPRNLLLARQSRLRVEAEIVRDLALAVSGTLSDKVGGPSVFPPQEDGVYAFTQRKMKWNTSQGEDRFRRGMYTFFYRSAPYPMLSTFDVPRFNQVCTSRDRSNTPLQSLTMANSEALQEVSLALGQRITSEIPEHEDLLRIKYAYQLCFARLPTLAEEERLSSYIQRCRDRFNHEVDVWSAVARVLINLDEFVTRE